MRSLKLGLTQLSWMTGNPINLPKCLTDHRKAKNYLFVISNYWMTFLWYSRIIKAEVGVINRSRRQRFITLTETLIIPDIRKPNLIIVLLYIERIFLDLASTQNVFKVCANSFFSSGCLSPCLPLFFRCLARSTKQTWKSCFCSFTDGKQHKARDLDIITLRNQTPRSYITWLPVTLSVLNMIIVESAARGGLGIWMRWGCSSSRLGV